MLGSSLSQHATFDKQLRDVLRSSLEQHASIDKRLIALECIDFSTFTAASDLHVNFEKRLAALEGPSEVLAGLHNNLQQLHEVAVSNKSEENLRVRIANLEKLVGESTSETDRFNQSLSDALERQSAAHTNLESRIAELSESMKTGEKEFDCVTDRLKQLLLDALGNSLLLILIWKVA